MLRERARGCRRLRPTPYVAVAPSVTTAATGPADKMESSKFDNLLVPSASIHALRHPAILNRQCPPSRRASPDSCTDNGTADEGCSHSLGAASGWCSDAMAPWSTDGTRREAGYPKTPQDHKLGCRLHLPESHGCMPDSHGLGTNARPTPRGRRGGQRT